MKCIYCNCTESRVVDSRPTEDGAIRRRRECERCQRRFTTYEKVEVLPLLVIKKDGAREAYNQEKLMGGIMKACEKRPVSSDQMMAIVSYVENQIQNTTKREISTNEIGEMVMQQLKGIDEVAYVRFASVYRQFKDVNSFMEELQDMLKK